MEIQLDSPEAQLGLGARLGHALRPPCVLYLQGDLGTGKTTLTRGILREFGHAGSVRSPTYTLMEPYELAGVRVHHLDLYRLGDPEELEYLGLRDLMGPDAIWIVEWPERGAGFLPAADLVIQLLYQAEGRRLILSPRTSRGEEIIAAIGDPPSRQS